MSKSSWGMSRGEQDYVQKCLTEIALAVTDGNRFEHCKKVVAVLIIGRTLLIVCVST